MPPGDLRAVATPATGVQVIDPNANPGRRIAEARKLRRAKRLADPLYLELLRERFGTSVWWTEVPPKRSNATDRRIQRVLKESLDRRDDQDYEESGAV